MVKASDSESDIRGSTPCAPANKIYVKRNLSGAFYMRFSWYGIRARIDALFHKIRHPSHKILWKTCADEICDGDITCETCNVIFWCRAQDLTQKELMRRIGEK